MRSRTLLAAAALAALLAACAANRPEVPLPVPAAVRTVEDRILYAATTWSGDVRLVRPLVVTRTATLTILPGTRVYFDLPEPATEGDRQPWILVMGKFVAVGTPEQPISFASVSPRRNDLDDMIQVQKAREAHLRHCVFERGPWALHVHETTVEVEACAFRDNYGGVRFQGDRLTLRGNRFERNTIGVRCLKASPIIEENTFLGNLTGIFFREGVEGALVRRNHFEDVEYDVKLGETQSADVDASQNWWALPPKVALGERVYDGADAPGVGRVLVEPALPAPWGASSPGGKTK